MKLDNRILGILTAFVVLALFAGGWFLGASPLLAQVGQADSQRATAAAQNRELQNTLNAFAEAKKHLPEMLADAETLAKAIPGDTESSAFITSLNGLAGAAGVIITAIEIQDGQPYEAPGAPAKDDAASTTPMPFMDGRITDKNFVVVPISITVTGSWQAVLNFTKGLQSADRLVLVTGVTATRNDGPDTFTAVLDGTMYVLPDPDRPKSTDKTSDEPTAEVTPAPSATPDPSTTPDPGSTPSPSATTSALRKS